MQFGDFRASINEEAGLRWTALSISALSVVRICVWRKREIDRTLIIIHYLIFNL